MIEKFCSFDAMGSMFGGGAAAPLTESASGFGAGIDPFAGGVGAGAGGGEFFPTDTAPIPAAQNDWYSEPSGGIFDSFPGAPGGAGGSVGTSPAYDFSQFPEGGVFQNFPGGEGGPGNISSREPLTPSTPGQQAAGLLPDQSDPYGFKKILPMLPGLATGVYGLFNKSPTEKYIENAQKQMAQIAGKSGKAGKGMLGQYVAGKLSAPEEAEVQRFIQKQRAQYNQYFAKAGIPVSTAMADAEAKIQNDASIYRNNLLQQKFQNSMTSMGLSQNSLANQAVFNAGMNQQIANAQAQAAAALGKLAGILFPGNTMPYATGTNVGGRIEY